MKKGWEREKRSHTCIAKYQCPLSLPTTVTPFHFIPITQSSCMCFFPSTEREGTKEGRGGKCEKREECKNRKKFSSSCSSRNRKIITSFGLLCILPRRSFLHFSSFPYHRPGSLLPVLAVSAHSFAAGTPAVTSQYRMCISFPHLQLLLNAEVSASESRLCAPLFVHYLSSSSFFLLFSSLSCGRLMLTRVSKSNTPCLGQGKPHPEAGHLNSLVICE